MVWLARQKAAGEAFAHPFLLALLGTTQDDRSLVGVYEAAPGGELFDLTRSEVGCEAVLESITGRRPARDIFKLLCLA